MAGIKYGGVYRGDNQNVKILKKHRGAVGEIHELPMFLFFKIEHPNFAIVNFFPPVGLSHGARNNFVGVGPVIV